MRVQREKRKAIYDLLYKNGLTPDDLAELYGLGRLEYLQRHKSYKHRMHHIDKVLSALNKFEVNGAEAKQSYCERVIELEFDYVEELRVLLNLRSIAATRLTEPHRTKIIQFCNKQMRDLLEIP